jgi:hypothetical protein
MRPVQPGLPPQFQQGGGRPPYGGPGGGPGGAGAGTSTLAAAAVAAAAKPRERKVLKITVS